MIVSTFPLSGDSRSAFPMRSLLTFVVGAVVLRALCMLAWALFPGADSFQQIARVAIPLLMVIGLVLLNRALLRRDGLSPRSLGLGFRQCGWFVVGGLLIVPVILIIAATFWLFVPYSWTDGSLSWSRFGWQALEYSVGNFAEELMFRGYLLLVLARHFGLHRALFIVALLFGVFHLPGLAGWAALKMVCTTALGSYLFAYGYLLTGTLWTAVGMHVIGNVVLHQVLGMSGGKALLTPVLQQPWPATYDPAFLSWVLVSGAAVALVILISRRLPIRVGS